MRQGNRFGSAGLWPAALRILIVLATFTGSAFAQTVGEMFASDASVRGSVLFASGGTQIQSGSSLSAGDAAAVLRLARGGELRICPKTTVSVAASSSGRDLLWGMNTGSVEAHFDLPASADTIMTPDFRILLAGPGTFHFAFSANARGDTCMKALPSNTASLIVTELNGDGTYQVKANEQVIFHGGSLSNADGLVPPDCGCPPPRIQMQQAQVAPARPSAPAGSSEHVTPAPVALDLPENRYEAAKVSMPFILPPPDDPHLQMESPFVYSPADPEQEMVTAVSRLRLTSGAAFVPAEIAAPQPAAKMESPPKVAAVKTVQKRERKGFFGKVGSFFSAIFR